MQLVTHFRERVVESNPVRDSESHHSRCCNVSPWIPRSRRTGGTAYWATVSIATAGTVGPGISTHHNLIFHARVTAAGGYLCRSAAVCRHRGVAALWSRAAVHASVPVVLHVGVQLLCALLRFAPSARLASTAASSGGGPASRGFGGCGRLRLCLCGWLGLTIQCQTDVTDLASSPTYAMRSPKPLTGGGAGTCLASTMTSICVPISTLPRVRFVRGTNLHRPVVYFQSVEILCSLGCTIGLGEGDRGDTTALAVGSILE